MPEAEVDHFTGKVIGLLGLGVFAAWIFGYEFRVWFASPTGDEFLALVLLAVFSLVVFTITVFTVKGMQIVAAGAFLEVAVIWASLEGKFSVFTLVGLGVLFVFLLAGFGRGRADIVNSVKVKFFRTAYRAVPVATTGFVLFVTLYILGGLNFSQASFQRGAIDFLLRISESVAGEAVPGFSGKKSVDDVLRAIIIAKSESGISEADIAENLVNVKAEVTKATGFRLNGSERFSDALYNLTVAKLKVLAPAYQTLMFVVAGIIIFSLVKGLAFFINLAVMLLAFVAYQILISLNFIAVRFEATNKEIIIVD